MVSSASEDHGDRIPPAPANSADRKKPRRLMEKDLRNEDMLDRQI